MMYAEVDGDLFDRSMDSMRARFVASAISVPFLFLLIKGCGGDDTNPAAAVDSGTEAAPVDAKPKFDLYVPPDDTSTGPPCAPQPVDKFTPTWKPVFGHQVAKCTDAQVDDIMAKCFGANANQAACDAVTKADATCNNCLVSNSTASAYGAMIGFQTPALFFGNKGGCVAALSGDNSATGCGAKQLALLECEIASCGAVCPITQDPTSVDAFNTCQVSADNTVCQQYSSDASTCLGMLEIGDGGLAFLDCEVSPQEGFSDFVGRWGKIICGGAVPDGGTEGGTEGGTDSGTDSPSDSPTDGSDSG
jgi:hypothetical protein